METRVQPTGQSWVQGGRVQEQANGQSWSDRSRVQEPEGKVGLESEGAAKGQKPKG